MKLSAIKYLSYAVLVFGFIYITWHMGRAFERAGAEEVIVTSCRTVEDNLDCHAIQMEVKDYKRVYEEVLHELEEPTHKNEWNNKYMEFTKR